MKFIKIYSNDSEFKDIYFEDSVSFILSDGHSLGKTKLLEMLDFCLLKDKPSFLKLEKFKNKKELEFYLEIQIRDFYLTIKRVLNAPRNGISIKKSTSSIECLNEVNFDCTGGQDKALTFLNQLLEYQLAKRPLNFRHYLNYFLRTQDDQSDIFRLNKYSRSKDIDFKPIVATLLNIDGNFVKEKYLLEADILKLDKEISVLEFEIGVNKTKDFIEAEIELLGKIRDEKEKRFQTFDFYLEENNLSKELVLDVETKISKLNKRRNSLRREIEYINQASEDKLLIEMNEIDELFNEIDLVFPNSIKNEYAKVVEFNKNLSTERIEILQDNKKSFVSELDTVEDNLFLLNNQRIELLSVLTDTNTMSKFKKIEKEIIEIETNINREKDKLKKYESLESKISLKSTKNNELANIVKKIEKTIVFFRKNNNIKHIIEQYARIIFNEEALFSVGLNSHKNIEFNLKISNNNNFNNQRDDGHTFRKLLSFLFSIAILINNKKDNFFRFTVLDSPFDGGINEYQIGLSNAIKKLTIEHNIQVIITSILDEIKDKNISDYAKKNEVRFLNENDKLFGDF